MAQLFVNNANSKLVAGISNVSLSLQIAAGDGMKFPNPTGGDFFLVTLSKITSGIETSVEIVKVTARATDVFTIVRAQEGTTALAYAENDTVSLRVTAGVITSTEAHKNSVSNPHSVTKSQVGLSNVDNTADASKPVSTAQAAAIAAVVYTHPANHSPSIITQDALNRFVTDAEKTAWNAKQPAGTYAGGTGTANGTNTGDQDLSAYATKTGVETLTNKTATGLKETRAAVAASAIDLATGNYFSKTAASTLTWTVTNVPATGTAASFILDLTNGGSAAQTWWTGVKWAGGTAPTLTAAGRDVLGFFTHDGGTTWTGLVLGKDVK